MSNLILCVRFVVVILAATFGAKNVHGSDLLLEYLREIDQRKVDAEQNVSTGNLAAALEHSRRLHALYSRVHGESHCDAVLWKCVADGIQQIGPVDGAAYRTTCRALREFHDENALGGDLADARKTLSEVAAQIGAGNAMTVELTCELARRLASAQRLDEARELLGGCLEDVSAVGRGHVVYLRVLEEYLAVAIANPRSDSASKDLVEERGVQVAAALGTLGIAIDTWTTAVGQVATDEHAPAPGGVVELFMTEACRRVSMPVVDRYTKAHELRARYLQSQGRMEDALKCRYVIFTLRRLHYGRFHPKSVQSLAAIADATSRLEDNAKAAIVGAKVVEMAFDHLGPCHPVTTEVCRAIIEVSERAGSPGLRDALTKRVGQLTPAAACRGSYQDQLVHVAECCDRGADDEALVSAWNAIELAPFQALPYIVKGTINTSRGQIDDAIADYSQAVVYQPQAAKARIMRGILLLQTEDYQGAAADLGAVIEIEKAAMARGAELRTHAEALARALFLRAVARSSAGDDAKAMADLHLAATLPDAPAEVFALRGRMTLEAGDAAGAERDFARARAGGIEKPEEEGKATFTLKFNGVDELLKISPE